MSSKAQRPPVGEPWVWLTRELLSSDAWRSAGINARRLVDFLLIEHMGSAGKANGKLKAPHRQLVTFGIGPKYVADAIREAESIGLVECHRGGMRVATTFSLTWLPEHDGTPAADQWRAYRNAGLAPMSRPKSKNLPIKGEAALPIKGEADGANLPIKRGADDPKNLPIKGEALYRSSYQGDDNTSELEEGELPLVAACALRVAR